MIPLLYNITPYRDMKEIITIILIFILGILAHIWARFIVDIKQWDMICKEFVK